MTVRETAGGGASLQRVAPGLSGTGADPLLALGLQRMLSSMNSVKSAVSRALVVTLLLTGAGCSRPLVVLAPPAVEDSHIWIVPLSTPSKDRICVQTIDQGFRPCWTVGQLRIALVSLKAE